MATRHVVRYSRQHASATSQALLRNSPFRLPSQCICHCHRPSSRLFSSSSKQYQQQKDYKESFGTRLRKALSDTKIQWYPIPVGFGIAFLGLAQFYKVNEREKAKRREEEEDGYARSVGSDGESEGRPKKRHRVKPTGPWQVQVMSTLPLKAMSRIWGKFNELEIPYYLRVPGFKLYSFIFGVNLSEVSEPDLHVYPNLASFFYRTLKPGVRPLDPNQNALLSPSDGRVLQFGTIEGGEVEQVKGMTYSLDALLGSDKPGSTPNPSAPSNIFTPAKNPPDQSRATHRTGGVETIKEDEQVIKQDEEFATVNGISYTLPSLFSGGPQKTPKKSSDASTTPKPASEAEVRADLALGEKPWYTRLTSENRTALYYVVVYLAPGDYHRFHSPTAWVAEKRRHFAGELYSVSPYLQRTLPGLFTLNERVVLLGRWRWGFFSFIPVGATNVGSIKINFDRELRTNSLTTDTEADRAAEAAAKRGEPYSGFAEATYERASPILHGHALRRGEEMGGFQLGSTVVLVFEAPKGQRPSLDEGWMGEKTKRKGGWNWAVEKGQRVKMGEKIGWVDES